MKTTLLIFLSIIFISWTQVNQIDCPTRFQPILEKIQTVPEGRALVDKALEEGNIQIRLNTCKSKAFEGYWDVGSRTIYLTVTDRTKDADLITTLLFELHNAVKTKDFNEVDRLAYMGKINKKDYIRQNEYIEYQNVIETAKILDKGRKAGIFPPGCRWNYNDNFEDHLRVQKRAGHSAYFGHSYDNLCC